MKSIDILRTLANPSIRSNSETWSDLASEMKPKYSALFLSIHAMMNIIVLFSFGFFVYKFAAALFTLKSALLSSVNAAKAKSLPALAGLSVSSFGFYWDLKFINSLKTRFILLLARDIFLFALIVFISFYPMKVTEVYRVQIGLQNITRYRSAVI
jgi:hypothetical protein